MNMNKSYEQGRTYARKAHELDKTKGEPFIIIGNLYAASSKECGKSEVETKAAFWAAVDQFEKAKALDPSVTAKANELINAYSHSFPSVETLFFNGYEEGQEYSLENCWIGGKTKIRAAKN